MLTLSEIKERLLMSYDPDDLIDALKITSEELLDRFEDRLLRRLDQFAEELEEEGSDEYDYEEGQYDES